MKSKVLISGNPRPSNFKPTTPIYFYTDEKKPESFDSGFLMVVGEEGFEPPTLWSQTRCATKLRYSPTMFRLTRPRSLIKDNLNNGVANEA